jgi:3-hydroxybutyryl-CoA dehydratase
VGLHFEDFESSDPVTTRGRTVTESDIVSFAGLTGDFVELHTNEEFAKQTPFGRRIAHGALVFSISIGLTTRMNLLDDTLLAFAGVDKLRFMAPVFIGDTIRTTKRVVERRALGAAQGSVVFETKVLNQRDETVLIYRDKMLIKRRPTAVETADGP